MKAIPRDLVQLDELWDKLGEIKINLVNLTTVGAVYLLGYHQTLSLLQKKGYKHSF